MVAISLDNPKELRRVDRLKKLKRDLEQGYKEYLLRDNDRGGLSQLIEKSLQRNVGIKSTIQRGLSPQREASIKQQATATALEPVGVSPNKDEG